MVDIWQMPSRVTKASLSDGIMLGWQSDYENLPKQTSVMPLQTSKHILSILFSMKSHFDFNSWQWVITLPTKENDVSCIISYQLYFHKTIKHNINNIYIQV